MIHIFPEDCIAAANKISTGSVHLGIFDPPFGIGESAFDKHYNRNDKNVLGGYQEAPADYYNWTLSWLSEAKRVLHPDGSIFIIIGHSKLRDVLNAAHYLGLYEVNHLIWKYNFGVNTKKKFVTSHYHVLYYSKSEKARRTFNLNCRFGSQEKDATGGSVLYQDIEDVFCIKKEYATGKVKNQNKLPEELISKIVQYCSNENDLVCDFFMGNFTTGYVARKLGRRVCGFEINKTAYDYHMPLLNGVEFGSGIPEIVFNQVPLNQGKKVTEEESVEIHTVARDLRLTGMNEKSINQVLQSRFGRGKFSIINILKRLDENESRFQLQTSESGIQGGENAKQV